MMVTFAQRHERELVFKTVIYRFGYAHRCRIEETNEMMSATGRLQI